MVLLAKKQVAGSIEHAVVFASFFKPWSVN